jgi:ribokinase
MLVTDFEIPVQIVRQAAQAASEHGHTTAVDLSPSNRVNPNLFPHIHYLIPNAGEVTHLIGRSVESVDTAFAAAASLHERSARTVLVKLRPRACAILGSNIQEHVTSTGVQPLDPTGDDDAFAGVLSVAYSRGNPCFRQYALLLQRRTML